MGLAYSLLAILGHSLNIIFQKKYRPYSNKKKYDEYMRMHERIEWKGKTFQQSVDEAIKKCK